MEAINQDIWNDQDSDQPQGNALSPQHNGDHRNDDPVNENKDYFAEDITNGGSDNLDPDELDENEDIEEINDNTDDFLSEGNADDDYDKKLGDDIDFDEDNTADDELVDDDDNENILKDSGAGPDPNEIPEKKESEEERSGYPHETEYQHPQEGNDTSFSEQTDVTPPNQKEFPSTGAPAEFENRPQGRTTGRMIGHEPGTEGI